MKWRFRNETLPSEVLMRRGEGAAAVVLVGTAGVKRGIKALRKIERAGYAHYVGAIAVIDFDSKALAYWDLHAPAVFKTRAVTTQHASKPLGFTSDPPPMVLADWGLWFPEVEDTLDAFALQQLACQVDGTDPGLVLLFGSGGGHAMVTVAVARAITERFPDATTVVSFPIPDNSRLRGWARETIEQLLALDITQVVVQDDRVDANGQDEAWATLVTALLGGFDANNLQDVAPVNLFSHAAPAGATRAYLAVQETQSRRLPSKLFFHQDVLGPDGDRFSLRADVVQTESLRLIRRLHNALGLPLRVERVDGGSLIRVVAAELEPASLQKVASKVLRTLKYSGAQDWETELVFASLTGPYPPVPERATVELSVIDYYVVADAQAVLDQVFGAATEVTPQLTRVAPELVVAGTRPLTPTGNGNGNGYRANGRWGSAPHHLSVRLNAQVH